MKIQIPANAPLIPHKKHWRFCVGSGHALLALRTDYVKQLRFIHDTLGIQRVRFHGILNDDMRTLTDLSAMQPVPGAEAFTEYNFNACGLAYDNVLEAGMKPFVELSFMPAKLASRDPNREKTGMFFYDPIIVPPEDWSAWEAYITAFTRFLIHRYGAEEVRTWYFEVWNEPDLPGIFWNGTRDEYFRLYAVTARAIKAVDPGIRVGGPSSSNSKWIKSFLAFCGAESVPVDFVSTHQYAGDPIGGAENQGSPDDDSAEKPVFNRDGWRARAAAAAKALETAGDHSFLTGFRLMSPDKSETDDLSAEIMVRNAHTVRRQAGDYPLFYTEWNENAIFSAWTNDTRKAAAYDVKTALDVADDLDGSSIWCFSDIFEELHPFPQEFHGGFGMLSQSGIPKPVYHAMKMLADAGDQRLDLGPEATKRDIGCAAFRGEDGLQVLLFRLRMKNTELPAEPVTLSVGCPEAPARVTVRRVDEIHGNPLRIWQEMGSPVSLNRAEVDEIRKQSAVEDEPWPCRWENGAAVLEASLGCNDIWFFTLHFPCT